MLRRDAFIAHMTGATRSLEDTTGRCTRTTGTRSALAIRLTVSRWAAAEMVAFHATLEALTFAGTDDIHALPHRERFNS